MSELIYELSDSELDAIAGGQESILPVGGDVTVPVTTTSTAGASVTNSIDSSATASSNTGTTITIG